MPGGISTPQERGYFAPGNVIEDAVTAFVQDQIRRAQEKRTARRFSTDQAVNEADAAPKIDPQVIADSVLAAQLGAHRKAADEKFIGGLPDYPRLAVGAGQLPKFSEETTEISETGLPTRNVRNGFMGQDGVMAPFGGGSVQGAPPVSTSTTIKPQAAGAPPTPGLQILSTTDTVIDPKTGKPRTVATRDTPQRVTPAGGDTALLDWAAAHGVDPDDLSEMVDNLLKKKTAPTPPPRAGTPESLNAQLAQLNGELKTAADPEEKDFLTKQIANIQGRIDALNRQFTLKPGRPSTAEAVAAAMGLTAPAAGAATAAPAPGRAAAPPPVKGQIYKDAKGNRARWDGTKYVELAAGE